MSEMSKPKLAARGVEASRSAVDVWDVCYRSAEPLTIDQIAEALKVRGRDSGYMKDALVAYRASLEPHIAALVPEAPDAEFKAVAWRFWVTRIVRSSAHNKWLITHGAEGKGPAIASPHALYTNTFTANRKKPPMVYREELTVQRRLVPYDPERRDQANEAQTAGMRFLRESEVYLTQHHRTPEPVKELLELAATAIRARRTTRGAA